MKYRFTVGAKQYLRDAVDAVGAIAAAKVESVEKAARDAFRVFEQQAKSMTPPAPAPEPVKEAAPPAPPSLTEQWQALNAKNVYLGAQFYHAHQRAIDAEIDSKKGE